MRTAIAIAGLLLLGSGLPASPSEDTLTPELARAQRSVWEAWFAGDTAQVRALTPGLVAISASGSRFDDQESTIQSSADFKARGGRLLDLSFSDLHVRTYGNVVMVYSRYHVLALMGADTIRSNGRATEVFVRQHGRWLNPGWHLDNAH